MKRIAVVVPISVMAVLLLTTFSVLPVEASSYYAASGTLYGYWWDGLGYQLAYKYSYNLFGYKDNCVFAIGRLDGYDIYTILGTKLPPPGVLLELAVIHPTWYHSGIPFASPLWNPNPFRYGTSNGGSGFHIYVLLGFIYDEEPGYYPWYVQIGMAVPGGTEDVKAYYWYL